MSLKDDQGADLQAGSDGLVAGLMGLQQQQQQQQQSGGNGLQSQGGNDAMGGMAGIMGGGQTGIGDLDGQQGTNSLLAQQQALMAMAAGGDNGSNKDALMNLLAKQGM